jgi:hypothetical protein
MQTPGRRGLLPVASRGPFGRDVRQACSLGFLPYHFLAEQAE